MGHHHRCRGWLHGSPEARHPWQNLGGQLVRGRPSRRQLPHGYGRSQLACMDQRIHVTGGQHANHIIARERATASPGHPVQRSGRLAGGLCAPGHRQSVHGQGRRDQRHPVR